MPSTIKDVAKRTGLSLGTISKFLNGGTVKEANRLLLESAIIELDFKINRMAQGLKTSKSMTVGILIPDLENIFCTSIVSVVENLLQEHGYSTIICDYRKSPVLEGKKLGFLVDKRIDGLLMMPLDTTASELDLLSNRQIPVVMIDRPLKGFSCDTVLVDNLNASYHAVEHLILQGHRRIGIIVGPESVHTAEERLKGYLRVHEDYNLQVDNALIMNGEYTTEGGYMETNALLDRETPPTALYVTNYEMTLGAIMAINERNIDIPQTLSMIGFDNQALTRITKPALTIVVQPIRQIGETAAQTLIQRMQGDMTGYPTLYRMKTELLLKDSVRKIL